MPVRLSARSRLAVLYTALVLVTGVVMTAITYVLMRQNLTTRWVLHRVLPGTPVQELPSTPELPDLAEQVRAATLSELLAQAAIALAVVTVLAAALGWLVAGRVLRPIRTITATARRLSAENLSERVPVPAPADELAALAETVNGMLDRIERGIAERDRVLDSQRMFTANAAHELRTPLTTVRTAIDVTLDGEPSRAELLTMAADIRAAVDHSRRTLDGLFALARSHAAPGARGRTELADVAAGILDRVAGEAAGRGIAVRTDLRPAPVDGQPVLLERMVDNLVNNAIRYNHGDGRIAVTTGMAGGGAFLRVVNTGRPISPHEAGRLLEPFVRGDADRVESEVGAGLGLAIVRAVVSAHGGEISTTARPGGGLDVVVCLPAPA